MRVVARTRALLRSEPSLTSPGLTPVRRLSWAIRGLFHRSAFVVASALAFDTVLALVPFLALVVATLKGLGAYEPLRANVLLPWIERTFPASHGEMSPIAEAFDRILAVVDAADVGSLGIAGLVSLLYVVWSLLYATQSALDDIVGATRRRTIGRTLADYAALLFIAPLSIITVSALFSWAARIEAGMVAPEIGVHVASIAAVGVAATAFFLVMPSRRMPLGPTALGGFVAGALVYAVFVAQVKAQLGAVRYDLLYSGFAAIPLFLLWVFATWVALLFGAELASVCSDEASYCERLVGVVEPSPARERTAIVAFVSIARRHVEGAAPLSERELASRAGVSARTLRATLAPLVAERVLVRGPDDEAEPLYGLARDPDTITPAAILRVVRGEVDSDALGPEVDPLAGALVAALHPGRASGMLAEPLGALLDRAPVVADPRGHAKGGARSPSGLSE